MRNLFFVLLSVTICSCTYHSQSKNPVVPISYEATQYRKANSVGNLRRLAVMPIEIKPYKGKYSCAKDQEAATLNYENAYTKFLNEKKGYEIVAVRDSEEKWRSELLSDSKCSNIKELCQKWHKDIEEGNTVSVIKKIGRTLNVDGVLVVHIKERKPWGVTEGLLNIALLDIPLFYNIFSPEIGVWIYGTATGQLIWREERSIFITGDESVTTDSLISLFADLENAVPQQLTK
jgi:hypothetical protein